MNAPQETPDPAKKPSAKARSAADADREAKILKKALEMPLSVRNCYLRAARGEAPPRGAIKAFCHECMGNDRDAIKKCTAQTCPNFLYRPYQDSEPTDAFGCEGESVHLLVSASGTPPPTYQWHLDGEVLGGENRAELRIAAITAPDGGLYHVVVTNEAGSVSSRSVAVRVDEAPAISSPPGDAVICAGEDATLRVGATGTVPLSYEWRRNGVVLTRETADTLVIRDASSVMR